MNEPIELPKKELCGLTESQFKKFSAAFNATYGEICCDCEGYNRAEMIEAVCDADRMLMFGDPTRHARKGTPSDYPEFYKTVIDPMLEKHYDSPVFRKMMKRII